MLQFCRYGLIRQQMLLANKAYAAVVEAVASEEVPSRGRHYQSGLA